MTEKEKLIKDLLELVKQPLAVGENPISVTDLQIEELNGAADVDAVLKLAQGYGWNDYVKAYVLSQPSTSGLDIDTVLQQALSNTTPNTYIGTNPNDIIIYDGEAVTIGSVGDNFYRDGEQNSFEGLGPDAIRELQADLINANLLGTKVNRPFRPGVWDKTSKQAMADLMSAANQNGKGKNENGWERTLQIYLDNPVQYPTQTQSYLPPDYKTLANAITGLFQRDLNRDPTVSELKLLSNQFNNDSEKAYKQSLKLEGTEQIATPTSLEEYGNHTQSDIQEEGLTQIDPGARLQSSFANMIKPEQERIGTFGDIQTTNNIILDAVRGPNRSSNVG